MEKTRKQILNSFLKAILLLAGIIPFSLYSQNCYTVKIQKNKEINTANFYFNTVIDARADTSKIIGRIYSGALNIPQCANFKNNVSETVLSFLQKTYSNKKAPGYLLKINQFYINELIHKNKEDTGLVHVDFDFYKYTPTNELIYITSVSKTLTDKLPDATYSHDNRLKRIILSSVNDFEKVMKESGENFALKTTTDVIKKMVVPLDSNTFKVPLSPTEKYKLIMQLQGGAGWYTNTVGFKLGALFFLKNQPKVGVGPSIFWDYISFNKQFQLPQDVSLVQYNIWNTGLNTFIRINKYIGVTVDAALLFGTERVTKSYLYYEDSWTSTGGWQRDFYIQSKTTSDFIGGFRAEQGLQFMRKEKRGVNIKLSFYETILTADYFENDYGIKLSCGINF